MFFPANWDTKEYTEEQKAEWKKPVQVPAPQTDDDGNVQTDGEGNPIPDPTGATQDNTICKLTKVAPQQWTTNLP